jgi:hypothetical protein
MRTKEFWVSAAERGIKTFAQSLAASLIVFVGVLDVDWVNSLSAAGLATLLSFLSSVGSAKVGPDNSPSLVGEPPQEEIL